jgi:hypothetical protein
MNVMDTVSAWIEPVERIAMSAPEARRRRIEMAGRGRSDAIRRLCVPSAQAPAAAIADARSR